MYVVTSAKGDDNLTSKVVPKIWKVFIRFVKYRKCSYTAAETAWHVVAASVLKLKKQVLLEKC